MALEPQITITANMQDITGAEVTGGSLVAMLCGYGSQIPRIAGTSLLARTAPLAFTPNDAGEVSETLWGNDVITPAGTYYTFAARDDNGNTVQLNAYQFTGTASYDLSSAALYDPPPPSILELDPVLKNPQGAATQTIDGSIVIDGNLTVTGTINQGGLYVVSYSTTPVFDGNEGSGFKITLAGPVTSSTASNMANKLLVPFRIVQDGSGGHVFVWPANVRNAGIVNQAPGAVSLQVFMADTDGSLDSIAPMQYSFP